MLERSQPESGHMLAMLYCPVCDTALGMRFPEDKTWISCDECRCKHLYLPHQSTPVRSVLDSHHKSCGCGRCGR